YFNKNRYLIRLAFALPILLSVLLGILDGMSWNGGFGVFPNIVFGSLTGTLILTYIILWILLPEATGPYQKMEMRGEKVDVNSISQNVKSTANTMAGKIEGWSKEVQ